MTASRVIFGLVGSLAAATASCTALTGFTCLDDAQCRRDGAAGVCEPVGYCAYPDVGCESGLRFSPDAGGGLARECTDPRPAATTTTTTSGDESSSGADDDGTTTTGGPVCGNGQLEADEVCDDGNDEVGDGCNPDCRESGVLVTSLASGFDGVDFGRAVAVVGDEFVVVGEGDNELGDRDAIVARFGSDGTTRWSVYRGGNADAADRGRALSLTETDTVIVGGEVRPDEAPDPKRSNFWVAELQLSDGAYVWQDTDGAASPSHEYVAGLVRLPGGDLVIAGRGGPLSTSDQYVRRYAVGGGTLQTVWTRTIDGAAGTSDWASAIVADAMGRLVVGGATHATAADLDRRLQALLVDDGADPRPPCVDDGTGSDGRVPEGQDQILGLAVGPTGYIAAVGQATKTATEGLDAWVGWYDPTGCTLQWTRTVTGAAQLDDAANAVAVDDRGDIITAGHLRDTNTADIWVAKWTDAGEIRWQAEPVNGPGDGTDSAYGIALDPDTDEIVVTGRLSVPPDSADIWVARYTP